MWGGEVGAMGCKMCRFGGGWRYGHGGCSDRTIGGLECFNGVDGGGGAVGCVCERNMKVSIDKCV